MKVEGKRDTDEVLLRLPKNLISTMRQEVTSHFADIVLVT